jgi:hypothetical protein
MRRVGRLRKLLYLLRSELLVVFELLVSPLAVIAVAIVANKIYLLTIHVAVVLAVLNI